MPFWLKNRLWIALTGRSPGDHVRVGEPRRAISRHLPRHIPPYYSHVPRFGETPGRTRHSEARASPTSYKLFLLWL